MIGGSFLALLEACWGPYPLTVRQENCSFLRLQVQADPLCIRHSRQAGRRAGLGVQSAEPMIFVNRPLCCWYKNWCPRAAEFVLTSCGYQERKRSAEVGRRFCGGPLCGASGRGWLLILAEWEEFASLDLERLRDLVKYPVVLDGRWNLYDPAEMLEHRFSLGCPAALMEELPSRAFGRKLVKNKASA